VMPGWQHSSTECCANALQTYIRSLQQPYKETLPHNQYAFGAKWFSPQGQVVLLPVQFCAGTGGLTLAALHTVLLGCSASAGHSAVVPLHCSAASQSPAAVLQTVPLGRYCTCK
jgi:hypothetical protein